MTTIKKTHLELAIGDRVLIGGAEVEVANFRSCVIFDGSAQHLAVKDDAGDLWLSESFLRHMGSLNDDNTYNVKAPELKPGSWVPLADVPEGVDFFIVAEKLNGGLSTDDYKEISLVLIPPTIQTVGAYKSGDMVRLGDLPVGTRIVATVEEHNADGTTRSVIGKKERFSWVVSGDEVELA